MPKITTNRIIIGIIAAVALIIVGAIFLSVPQPGVHLSPNYGGHGHPEPFTKLGPIYITNTLIATWMTVVVLLGFFYMATRRMRLVPSGLQNLAEALVELILDFMEGVAGKENARRFFPVIATIFLFVLVNAWMGLLPIFNVFGWGEHGVSEPLLHSILPSVFPEYDGFIVETAMLRPANTDINVPLMLALVSFLAVEYWGITAVGFRNYTGKFFRFGQFFQGIGRLLSGKVKEGIGVLFYGAIDIFVGFLELLSEFVRIISFTFRLFGNMTAGEVLLLMMMFVVPLLWPNIFYFLELMLGSIQALIFAGLTLVFATLAVTPHNAGHD